MTRFLIVVLLFACSKDNSREKELELELAKEKTKAAEAEKAKAEAERAKAEAEGSKVETQAVTVAPPPPTPRTRETSAPATPQAPTQTPTPQRVIDAQESIKDGQARVWKLDAGRYRVGMTAVGDGATVTWVGGSCPQAKKQTSSFTSECTLTGTGQLSVANPGMGFGGAVVVSVTLDKLE